MVFFLVWIMLFLMVASVHFWFVSGPVMAVIAGGAVVRSRRERELRRHRPGRRDPWLNEVAVALADLSVTEEERNTESTLGGSPVEGQIGVRADRLTVDICLFANQVLARQAVFGLRAKRDIRADIDSGSLAIEHTGRVVFVARQRGGVVDEYDFHEIVEAVGAIAVPPPLAVLPPPARPTQLPVVAGPPVRTASSTAPVRRPPPTPTPDALDQLARLGRLRDSGVLTEDEFQAKKSELLDRI